ncbi:MAG: hypothetical protein IJS00_00710 [Paludibacteraceae bacterium]|nr:hypothetical protein [Paludibacteraceae bacterium]
MKKSVFIGIVFCFIGMAMFTGCGQQQPQSQVLYPNHKPYTRWWWHSAVIDTNAVRDQLVWMKEHEFGGVEIAWIYPMFCDPNTPHPAFLSEQWAEPVEVAKRVADSLGLGCDFTFGTMWPFADVDLPDGDQTRNFFDSTEIARRPLVWDHPREALIINHLNKQVFERYAKKMNDGLKNAYKGSRSGLFVDSWEVETEYLYTPGFEQTFMSEHGYDILPYLRDTQLLDMRTHEVYDHEVFYDYMHTLSGYVLREFYQPFADNANRNHCFSRAQCGGAPTDLLTAFTLVDIPETEAILYEPCFSKIAASAATLGKKDAVTAETFTCAYGWTSLRHNNFRGHSPHQGTEQIADLRLICDALFANGTNQVIWHGMPFNQLGDSSNYFYTTCQVSMHPENNLTGEPLTNFNRYMTTVQDYMRRGVNYTDVAVYMPLEDAWMAGAYPPEVNEQMKWLWGQYEMRFIQTPEQLKGRQPMWVNEHFLTDAHFADGVLECGKTTFRSLYTDVEYMELTALQTLVRLAGEGLPICLARLPKEPGKVKHEAEYEAALNALQKMPTVSRNYDSIVTSLPLIEGTNLPDFWVRADGNDYFAFVANPMTQTIRYPLEYEYAFTDQGSERDITVNHHGRTDTLTLRFRPNESLMLHINTDGVQLIDLNYTAPHLRSE